MVDVFVCSDKLEAMWQAAEFRYGVEDFVFLESERRAGVIYCNNVFLEMLAKQVSTYL